MGKVTEIKKANGEVMRIIDGEYVIGASSGCFANPSPCRKIINGEYLVEGECKNVIPCGEYIKDGRGFLNITENVIYLAEPMILYEVEDFENLKDFYYRNEDIIYNNEEQVLFKIYHKDMGTKKVINYYADCNFDINFPIPEKFGYCNDGEPDLWSFPILAHNYLIKDRKTGNFYYINAAYKYISSEYAKHPVARVFYYKLKA